MAPDRVTRLRGPAGLDIGAITPEEIALAILADIDVEKALLLRSRRRDGHCRSDVERRIEGFDLSAEPAAAMSFVVVRTQRRGDGAALAAALLSGAPYVRRPTCFPAWAARWRCQRSSQIRQGAPRRSRP